MQYMLLIYGDESAGGDMTQEEGAKLLLEYTDYSQWLVDKGWMRAGDPLRDTEHATTVRVRSGETVTTDGPFAETKGCRKRSSQVCFSRGRTTRATRRTDDPQGRSVRKAFIRP